MFSLLLLIVIYLAFISLGLPDSMLGAAWPMMFSDLGVPVSYAGFISVTTCLGTTIASLIYAKVNNKFSTWFITLISVACTALALISFSLIHSFPVLIAAALLLGIGAGAVDAGLNNYVALHYKARAMNFLHAFWGVGTLVGPFLLSYFFANGMSWRNGYFTIGSIQSAICIVLLLSHGLWKKAGESTITESGDKPKLAKANSSKLSDAIKQKGAIDAMLGFLSYCAMEQSSMLWASTFLVSVKGFSESSAAASAGLLFWGVTAGRIISGLIAYRVNGKTIIRVSQLSILLGIMLVIFVPERFAGYALFFLGLGYAPIYPTMLHQTPEFFGEEYSARIMGLEMSSAYIGSALLPALFGVLGRSVSMNLFPPYIILILIINIIAVETKMRRAERKK